MRPSPKRQSRNTPEAARRLRDLGPKALGEAELIAVLLDRRREGALARAERLLAAELPGLAGLCVDELVAVHGLSEGEAARVAAAFEIAARLPAARAPCRRPLSAASVARLVAPRLRGLGEERMLCVLVDARRRLIGVCEVAAGSADRVAVRPADVLRPALLRRARGFFIAHNHPTGDPTPSDDDVEVTLALREAARLVGIELVDHVVVGDPGWVSLRRLGAFGARR